MHFCTVLLNLFSTNYCFVIHEVQPFKMVLSTFKSLFVKDLYYRERGGVVVERRTPNREVLGSNLTGVTVLCP